MRLHALLITLSLAACAGPPKPVAVAVVPVPPPPPPALTPINAGLSPAATLWHLRTGLNVAALGCRGPEAAGTVARYNGWIAAHAAALDAARVAHEAEYAGLGDGWRARYDDDQTRLYNFWAQARARDVLCATAGEALVALADMDDAALAQAAPAQLAALDRPFAPPRLGVDARVFTGPTKVMVALR